MAEPEYPILRELETKLKLLWVDTDDYMATQRAIIQVEPELAYLELPRGRKGDKGDAGPAISIQGIITADSQLPASAEVGHAYVNTSTKGLAVWNGSSWFKVDNFAGVDADVQQFSRWLAQLESEARRAANAASSAADAAKRAEFAAEETIQQVEGDFATRNYADSKEWHRGPITAAHQTMADVGVGAWNIASREHAVRLGLPMDYGSLQVMSIGSSRTAFFLGQSTGMWINASSGTTWGEWQHVPDSDDVSAGNGAAGLKTVAMALTSGSVLDGVAGRYRVLTQVTAPVVRWRIHVESRRMVFNTTSAFTLGNVYVGNHSGNGDMSGQQQIKSGNSTVAAGDEWVSPWMDASLLANETLIDLNVTGSSLFKSQATSWVYQNGSWASSKDLPVSIWVELETFDQVPVVGMIGDSTGAGQGADRPVFDSALYIAARKDKFIPMAYVYPGSSMQSMNDYDLHIYQRWAHLDKPDSVIIQSGSNDIHGGASTAELQTRFVDLVETAENISPVVIGATVKARYPNSGEYQTTLNAHNAFVKTRANGNRDYLDFYQAVSPTGTVAAADAADAAHLSTSGHQKLASAFDAVTVSRKGNPSINESVESRLLEHVNSSEVSFSVVDEKGRRTWLEAGHDGKPTEYALSLLDGATSGSSAPDFPTEDWAHWGDSNTDDYYLQEESWITKLSNLTGKNHYYGGFYNQKSVNIAARQGGAPSLVTVADNKTAATGATEIIEAVNPVTSISPIYQVPGTLAGVHGRIKPLAGEKQEFIPTTPGVYDIPPRSVFIPDAAAMRDRHMTIWMGRNDRYDDGAPQQVTRSARHMVDYLSPRVKRVLVLQLVPGTEGLDHPRIKPINDMLQAEFPSMFVPIAEWMMTDRAAELAGIEYTPEDREDISAGRIPTSFRSDGAHFNGVGCTAIAHFLHEEILKRGWL